MYKKHRVLAILLAFLILILADHFKSPTFAFNSGQGQAPTSLNQLDTGACAPCGAPCPSSR